VEAATVGTIVLWGAIAVLFISLISPRRVSSRLMWFAAALTWLAVLVLLVALLSHDFSLEYVARTTSRATPWPYRISALWGGMEGSLLFYAALVIGIGVHGVRRHGRIEQGVVAVVGLGFLLLTVLGANPFSRLEIPAIDGEGLLAILQHPAMIYHPPILYLGLTTLIVPFALTVGWVWGSRSQSTKYEVRSTIGWPKATRRWLTWAWTWLAIGMLAGANWAYIELGWGGYWAWDPVENTALMPWLAATVFLHASRVYQRDGRLGRWTVFFAMFPFAVSVLGVYLTRSGVTGSIHAFAEDPVIGKVLLTASVVITLFVGVMVLKSPRGGDWGSVGSGRDSWLAASSALVSVVLVFILVGSAYPAFLAVFWDITVVVGPRFFVTTVLPVVLVMVLLIGFALNTTWIEARLRRPDLFLYSTVVTVAAVSASLLAIEMAVPGVVLLSLAAGATALLVRDLLGRRLHRRYRPALLAHFGLALILFGAGGSALGTEFSGPMTVGDRVKVGPYDIQLVRVNLGESDRYVYAEGVFVLDGRVEMRPQVRGYERQRLPVAEPDLRSTPVVDVIIAVTRFDPDIDGFEVSVFVRPMVWWVWVGAVVVSLGGVLALRDGVSAKRRRAATEALPAAGTTT